MTLVSISACSDYSRKNFKSGVSMTDSANGAAYTTLNFRINRDAINQHSSLALLNQLKASDFELLPASWPVHELSQVTAAFKFLHLQTAPEFKLVEHSVVGQIIQLNFITISNDLFSLVTDRSVSHLTWTNSQGLPVALNKLSDTSWLINVDGEEMTWNTLNGSVCYLNSCLEIAHGAQ